MSQPLPPIRQQPPRLPNFKRFLITGAVIGFLVGALVSAVGAPVQGYAASTGVLYFGAFGALIGTGLAGVLAILLDRSGRDRA